MDDGGDTLVPDDGRDFVVPDDARELELDALALQRERRAARRKQRLRSLVLTRRYDRFGISGPIVFGVLLLLAMTAGAAVVLLAPNIGVPVRQADPLATAPVGNLDGDLLPSVQLVAQSAGGESATRNLADLRPSVVVLVPMPCDCRADMVRLILDSHSHGLRVHAVLAAPPADLGTELALTAEPSTGGGTATLDVDSTGTLASTFVVRPGLLTVLVVGADGRLLDVRPGWTMQQDLASLDQAAGLR